MDAFHLFLPALFKQPEYTSVQEYDGSSGILGIIVFQSITSHHTHEHIDRQSLRTTLEIGGNLLEQSGNLLEQARIKEPLGCPDLGANVSLTTSLNNLL